MSKLFHTSSACRVYLVFGLIALFIAPPVVIAKTGGSGILKKLKSAEVVTERPRTTSRLSFDPDRDGLSSWSEEHRTKTNPRKFDTDGDGFGDGAEVFAKSNPRSRGSVPQGPPAPAPSAPTPPPPVTPEAPAPEETPEEPADTTAPDTTIGSGPSGTTTSTGANLEFTSTESGSTFQCSLDSGPWAPCTSPAAHSSLAVASHTFAVKATDAAGNTDATPATRSWTVQAPAGDTTPPDTSIVSGPSGTTTSTSASFDFSSTESGSSFQCKLDAASWGACTDPKAFSSLVLGGHTVSARAIDVAGNIDPTPATRSWTVQAPADTTAPDTTIGSGPSGTTTSTGASLEFTSTESGSTFQCSLNSGSWAPCTSPKAYGSLAVGSHTFSVKATDAAGNTDATPATRSWTVQATEGGGGGGGAGCTQTLSSGANLSNAVSSASGGAVICLGSGSYSLNVSKANKSSMVTVKAAAGASPTLGYSMLNQAKNLRLEGLKFTGGIEMLGPSSLIQLVGNEFTGNFGIRSNGQEHSDGTEVTDVLIEGNNIHDLDYTGSQGTANGYGVTASNGVSRFTIKGNTIKSVAADYIQFASPNTAVIDHNTFLGPTLVGSHPQEHQDLVQIFGGGSNVSFTNNVARNTGTHESLLFQEGSFSNVVIENNLFDHDSRGYTCQLYQSKGMIFRNNTIVGSHWGCIFRDLASSSAGSGYQVDHNVFVDTEANSDISTEGRASGWGTYNYNVSSDGSASGANSVRNWSPSWLDMTNYVPQGLAFSAGYRP
jgi:hypothetical protein